MTLPDAEAFIRGNLRLEPVPSIPAIRLFTAHPGSGLGRLKASPYWAFPWAGGLVLARHLLNDPELVRGRNVLDLGAGGGIVSIAAAKAGAARVVAAEIDRYGVAALRLNAAANGVELAIVDEDLLSGEAPDVDLVLVGDLFYNARLAGRVIRYLDRCRAAGIGVLVGDPGRSPLPRERLRLVASHAVPDFGGASSGESGVYALD